MSFSEICLFFLTGLSIKVKLGCRPRLLGPVADIFHVQCAIYFSKRHIYRFSILLLYYWSTSTLFQSELLWNWI